jgi:hypothetical protein
MSTTKLMRLGGLATIAALATLIILGSVVGFAAAGEEEVLSVSGTIAYVKTGAVDEIWLIEPDGSNNRHLWSPGQVDPDFTGSITGLSWRPDAGTLAFASDHEWLCSWYSSDIYSIFPDGSGLRRVTNAPACAGLAAYPKGNVVVTVENYTFTSGLFGVYVQGAPGVKLISLGPFSSGNVEFTGVANLGDIVQPVVAIYGGYRWVGPAYANVQTGQTVHAGKLEISGSGFWNLGAHKSSWRHDGSKIGYTTTTCSAYHISSTPPAGHIGDPLLNTAEVFPCVIDWGPTAATAEQILYVISDPWNDDNDGIFLATVGSTGGTRLVAVDSFEGESVHDVKWLPDGSGFLFTKQHVDFGIMADVFEYNFTTGDVTQLTHLANEEYARNLSISPDGQQVVFDVAREFDGPSDLWIMQRDGSDLRLLVANAAHPAWSWREPQAPQRVYLPLIQR